MSSHQTCWRCSKTGPLNLLLDTHAFIWYLQDEPRLRRPTRELVDDPLNDVFVSAVAAWEIAIKAKLGKLEVPPNVAGWLPTQLTLNRFKQLPITVSHAAAVEGLPLHHRDPFDRLLIAQARAEQLTIVTTDAWFEAYDVRVIRC